MNKKLIRFILGLMLAVVVLGLVACGKDDIVNISFMDGDTVYAKVSINVKESIKKPQDPTKEGYVFEGWFLDDETFEEKYTEETIISRDISLYAKWKQVQWKVEFIDGNNVIKTDWIDIPSVDNPTYL